MAGIIKRLSDIAQEVRQCGAELPEGPDELLIFVGSRKHTWWLHLYLGSCFHRRMDW